MRKWCTRPLLNRPGFVLHFAIVRIMVSILVYVQGRMDLDIEPLTMSNAIPSFRFTLDPSLLEDSNYMLGSIALLNPKVGVVRIICLGRD